MTDRAAAADLMDVHAAIARTGRRAVEARFYLSGVTRRQAWSGQVDQGRPQVMISAEFQAARHGIFGRATPSGRLEMQIANPEAADLLDRAQLEWLTERGQSPVFRVFLVEELPEEAE